MLSNKKELEFQESWLAIKLKSFNKQFEEGKCNEKLLIDISEIKEKIEEIKKTILKEEEEKFLNQCLNDWVIINKLIKKCVEEENFENLEDLLKKKEQKKKELEKFGINPEEN